MPPTLYNFMLHITLCSLMRLNLNLINVRTTRFSRKYFTDLMQIWPELELFQDSSYLLCHPLLPSKHLKKLQIELNLETIVSRTMSERKERPKTKEMKKVIKVQQLQQLQKPPSLLFRWPMRNQAGEGRLTQTLVISLKCSKAAL